MTTRSVGTFLCDNILPQAHDMIVNVFLHSLSCYHAVAMINLTMVNILSTSHDVYIAITLGRTKMVGW